MTAVRPLTPSDFYDTWDLGKDYIDVRLKPDIERARKAYMRMLTDNSSLALGEFDGDRLVGAVMVSGMQSAYAGKGYASVNLWIGSVALLDAAIAWWDGRPVLRFMSLQFPNHVRAGLYRMLRMRGFHRSGDMNMLWR